MGLRYKNLDEVTRQYMLSEFDRDREAGRLYFSVRLSQRGIDEWPDLLRVALEQGTDDSLAGEIAKPGRLKAHDQQMGQPTKMNELAHLMLGEGEFNRYYTRGICKRAADEGRRVVAYRARRSVEERAKSRAMEGQEYDPAALLEELRTARGAFGGPNSGMSLRLE